MGNDGRQIVALRLPAEYRARALGRGDNLRRIAGARQREIDAEIDTGDLLHGLDHLAHRIAAPVAAVRSDGAAALAQITQRVEMRLHEIADMNVVAHAGAVRRRIA